LLLGLMSVRLLLATLRVADAFLVACRGESPCPSSPSVRITAVVMLEQIPSSWNRENWRAGGCLPASVQIMQLRDVNGRVGRFVWVPEQFQKSPR
jgi:hypothetical protein